MLNDRLMQFVNFDLLEVKVQQITNCLVSFLLDNQNFFF